MPQNGDSKSIWSGIENEELLQVLSAVEKRDPDQPEFHEAVKEVAISLQPVFERRPELLKAFEIMLEPERQITFRVSWLDDKGELQVNRAWRVQMSSALGPYKGGLRFRDGVNLSIIKLLAFEQTFKNALTTLPMGSGKGGSDFDPKGKSDAEIQRFCQSFMSELHKYIGSRTDIPAGDIGVGSKEIGYMFGQWKRLTGLWTSTLTGKGLDFGGSEIRPEATGYGVVLFAEAMLKDKGDKLEGKRCVVSGSGNVATFCAAKLIEKGAIVLALSDSKGYMYAKDGFNQEQLDEVMAIKSNHNGSLADCKSGNVEYVGDRRKPWEIDTNIDMAFPCATQNEISLEDAQQLTHNGCKYVVEGANMPTTADAQSHFKEKDIVFGPGKAANAGGVAVSGLEMVQNHVGLQWTREEVYDKLQDIMEKIYTTMKEASEEYKAPLAAGANIAAFIKVAETVLAQGGV